jgi:predicted O-methyltransferase YrrM
MKKISTLPYIHDASRTFKITPFEYRLDLLEDAIRRRPDQGLILEFGVWTGESINFLASRIEDNTIYGFDSFAGLPEDWRPGFEKGHFSTRMPNVEPNVELITGMFHLTLPGFLRSHQDNIAFVHFDCDLYSSTKTVLDLCRDRIIKGTTIIFDEYFNYPGWKDHEYKAFSEFISETGKGFEYFSAIPGGEQIGITIIA